MLSNEGFVLICIPIADTNASRKNGVNWIRLEAPRHVYFHTINSICILAEKLWYTVDNVKYNSSFIQFIRRQGVELGVTLVRNENIYDLKM